jgi:hypothetical protein
MLESDTTTTSHQPQKPKQWHLGQAKLLVPAWLATHDVPAVAGEILMTCFLNHEQQ